MALRGRCHANGPGASSRKPALTGDEPNQMQQHDRGRGAQIRRALVPRESGAPVWWPRPQRAPRCDGGQIVAEPPPAIRVRMPLAVPGLARSVTSPLAARCRAVPLPIAVPWIRMEQRAAARAGASSSSSGHDSTIHGLAPWYISPPSPPSRGVAPWRTPPPPRGTSSARHQQRGEPDACSDEAAEGRKRTADGVERSGAGRAAVSLQGA